MNDNGAVSGNGNGNGKGRRVGGVGGQAATAAVAIPSSSFSSPSSASTMMTTQPPLRLTVRFLSLPDMLLDIAEPQQMTVVGLKPLIRTQLMQLESGAAGGGGGNENEKTSTSTSTDTTPPGIPIHDAHRRRLRLIYGGKILADDSVLSRVLRPMAALAPPPQRSRGYTGGGGGGGGGGTRAGPGGPGRTGRSSTLSSSSSSSDRRHKQEATPLRIYINCSLGDVLSDSELMAEVMAAASADLPMFGRGGGKRAGKTSGGGTGESAAAAEASVVAAQAQGTGHSGRSRRNSSSGGGGGGRQPSRPLPGPSSSSSSAAAAAATASRTGRGASRVRQDESRGATAEQSAEQSAATDSAASATTTPRPRGFDRLLAAGFTAAEVNQLRLQFRSIQATRFTPDAMPSPDTLRAMEERWLDEGGPAGVGGPGGGYAGGRAGDANVDDDGADLDFDTNDGPLPADEDFGMPGLLDVMVRGMLVGFAFPLGAAGWLAREQGLWTRKWQVFVSFGVVLSLVLGTVKTLAGEW